MSKHVVTREDVECMLKCGWTIEQIKTMYYGCIIEEETK